MRIPQAEAGKALTNPGKCQRCGYMSSQAVCKACLLLEGLNRGLPDYGIRKKYDHQRSTAPERAPLTHQES